MNSAMYDSSFLTKRLRDKAISESFLTRIQRASNPTTGSAPLLGISQQSIINHVTEGQMSQFRKSDGGCTVISPGCPCGPASLVTSSVASPCPLNFYWATSVTQTDNVEIQDVAVGICGNVYAIGTAAFEADINGFLSPPPNSTSAVGVQQFGSTLYDNDNQFVFVIKYDVNGAVQWVAKIGQPLGDVGQTSGVGIAIDSAENVYVTGTAFSLSLSPPSTGGVTIYHANNSVFGTMSMSGTINVTNSFVVKYDTNGFAQWATYIGGSDGDTPPNYSNNFSTGIAVDVNSSVFVTGYYDNSASTRFYSYNQLLPGPTVSTSLVGSLSATSANSAYVVKFLTSGTVDWATNINTQELNGTVRANAIAVDTVGDVHIIGTFSGANPTDLLNFESFQNIATPFINTFPYGTLPANSSKDNDIFVAKYTGSGVNKGQVLWATSIITTGTSGDEEGLAIAVDANSNVYVTGYYTSAATPPITTGITIQSYDITQSPPGGGPILTILYGQLSAATVQDVLIVKYTSQGVATAVTNLTGVSHEIGLSIVTDTNANVYVSGTFVSNPMNVNSSALPAPTIITPSTTGTLANDDGVGYDAFIVKFTSSLTAQWANRISAAATGVSGQAIAVDPDANVYVVGDYGANATINSAGITSGGGAVSLTPYGFLAHSVASVQNGFLVKYNTGGQIA